MKNAIKGVAAGFVMFAMLFSIPALSKAQTTTANLQAQINSLLAIISQLQAQLSGSGTSTPTTGTGMPIIQFTTDMTIGSRSDEVVRLQQFLVNRGFLRIPAGVSYGYFGPLTRSALAAYQASQNITPAVGYFGSITRGRINATIISQNPPTGGTGTTTGTTTTPGGVITTPGVEGIMAVTGSNAGIRSTVYEAEDSVPILGFRIDADLSDISIQRARLYLGNNSKLYNQVLNRVCVASGTTELGCRDVDRNTVIREGDNYYIDIVGFNYIVPRNTSRDLTIRADINSSIDSEDRGSYTIALSQNGIRGIDGAGIDHYSPASNTSVTRVINVQESLAESSTLKLSLNSSSPRVQNVIASSGVDDDEIDRLTLLTFDVKAERDDVTIRDMEVRIDKTGSGTATATTVYLFDGNTEIDNASLSGNTATFRDIDYEISRDTTRTFSIRVDIRNANSTTATFTVSIPEDGIVAENSVGDQISSGDISGSATGYAISVRNLGPEVTLSSVSINTNGVPQGSGNNNMSTSTLTATFNLRIRAVGQDIILGGPGSTTPAFSRDSFQVYLNGASNNTIGSSASSTSFSTPSAASTAGLNNSFRIPEGTEVTIPVTFQITGRNPSGGTLPTGLYSVGFEGFRWYANGQYNETDFMAGLAEWRTIDVSFP